MPKPYNIWKWGVVALIAATILMIWFILVVKIFGWFVNLGKSSIVKVVESAYAKVQTTKGDKGSDEVSL